MQKAIKDLFRTIWRNSNILRITEDDLEIFCQKDVDVYAADVQSDNTENDSFKSLCTAVGNQLIQAKGKGYVSNMLLYIEMPNGKEGLTMEDLEILNQTRNQIDPNAQFTLAIGTHPDLSIRLAAIISVPLQKSQL